MFVSSFGSFFHSLLAGYYSCQLSKSDAETKYLLGYSKETQGDAPSYDMRLSFFEQGRDAIASLSPIPGQVMDVEQFVKFDVGDRLFIGFVDLFYKSNDGALVIMAYKSTALKPRSKRPKPTLANQKLDSYLRQLYLYSIRYRQNMTSIRTSWSFTGTERARASKSRFISTRLKRPNTGHIKTIDQKIARERNWRPSVDW